MDSDINVRFAQSWCILMVRPVWFLRFEMTKHFLLSPHAKASIHGILVVQSLMTKTSNLLRLAFMQSECLHAFTMLGTTPRTSTLAASTNTPNSLPKGDPSYSANVAPFRKAA